MDDFLKYFEDEKFVRWVYTPDSELDFFWTTWIQEHPEEEKEIQDARLILLQLRSSEETGTTAEAIVIYSDLINKLSESKRRRTFRRIFVPLMRYAAVALIFLSLGIFLMYQLREKQYIDFAQTTVGNENTEAQLVLSDGQKVAIKTKESSVEYKENGKIVINEKDTILNKTETAKNEMNQLIVPYGKQSSIRLPDGTTAYLNAGSRLMYPAVFAGKNREVFLLGEGYFEVSHNPQKPFMVKTNDINVVALGTVFNVSAYPADKIIETVLINGQVVIRDNSFHIFKKDLVLKPNDLVSFNRESLETVSKQVNTNEYVAWHEGYLNFQSVDLSRIILKVERYYNVRIMLENPMLGARSITGKLLLKDDKEKVMEALASSARVELFKINETAYGLK